MDLLKEQGVLQFKPIAREEKDRPAQGRKADAISLCGENKAWLIVDISNRQFTMTLMGFNMALCWNCMTTNRASTSPGWRISSAAAAKKCFTPWKTARSWAWPSSPPAPMRFPPTR